MTDFDVRSIQPDAKLTDQEILESLKVGDVIGNKESTTDELNFASFTAEVVAVTEKYVLLDTGQVINKNSNDETAITGFNESVHPKRLYILDGDDKNTVRSFANTVKMFSAIVNIFSEYRNQGYTWSSITKKALYKLNLEEKDIKDIYRILKDEVIE